MFHMSELWGLEISKMSFPQPLSVPPKAFPSILLVTIFTPELQTGTRRKGSKGCHASNFSRSPSPCRVSPIAITAIILQKARRAPLSLCRALSTKPEKWRRRSCCLPLPRLQAEMSAVRHVTSFSPVICAKLTEFQSKTQTSSGCLPIYRNASETFAASAVCANARSRKTLQANATKERIGDNSIASARGSCRSV